MWIHSDELFKNVVGMMDVLNGPDVYPKELVNALRDLHEGKTKHDYNTMYSIRGYIVQRGWVGVRPDAPQTVKDEWMEFWTALSKNPLINH